MVEKARARIAACWEGLSATYDEAPDHRLRGEADRAAWVALLKAVLRPPHPIVLDVGTGCSMRIFAPQPLHVTRHAASR